MSSLFNIAAGGQAGFYDYQIDNSLRFNDGSTANLSKTLPDSGDRQTWTFSAWVKRSAFPSNGTTIFSSFISSQNYGLIRFLDGDNINVVSKISDVNGINLTTNALFRDPSSWYHIVVAVDTTQSTSTDRVKIYVNGTQITSFSTSTYPSQNYNSIFNYNKLHYVGRYGGHTNANYDGYMAQVHLIDGQQLDPTSLGETKSGVWIPKDTSGLTFGTNGFRLEFGDSAAIGDDTSGNGNDWTATNLSAHDVVPDSPTLNYSTFNPLAVDYISNITYSEGNLKFNNSTVHKTAFGGMGVVTGKWYWEGSTAGSNRFTIGLTDARNQSYKQVAGTNAIVGYLPSTSYSFGDAVGLYADTLRKNGSTVDSSLFGSYATGDFFAIAFDADAGKVWISRNGTWANSGGGTASTTLDPDSNDTTVTTGETYLPAFSIESPTTWTVNYGQDSTFAGATTAGGNSDENGYGDFKYAVPSGFLALNSANLPEPDITPIDDDVPEDYFNTVLYNGASAIVNVTGVGFSPEFLWIKRRNASSTNHKLLDIVRGSGQALESNNTGSESDESANFSSFDSDGFTLPNVGAGAYNVSGGTYVAWNWLAGGTAVSNTEGTIASSVSANTEAGFSIVSYTGTGSAATIGHGLSQTPDMMIVKNRDDGTRSWIVYHKDNTSAPETDFLRLDGTNATADFPVWNDTAPTSSVFSVNDPSTNGSGNDIIAYCFHSVEGYSKFGSYTGNGSTNGTFVYTGFRPAWVTIKQTDAARDWWMLDNKRDPDNVVGLRIRPNSSNAEEGPDATFDYVANGFKIRGNYTTLNASGGTYIYMAFAEMPFKYANAR